MNIFGIGGAELILILVIMLVVAGPKRMIRWAYVLGVYVGKLRTMWSEVVDVVQHEMDEAGLDVQLPREPPSRQRVNTWARDQVRDRTKSLTQPVEDTLREVRSDPTAPRTPGKAGEGEASRRNESQPTPSFGSWSGADKPVNHNGGGTDSASRFGTWSSPPARDE